MYCVFVFQSTSSDTIEKGLTYMEQAARYGDRSAMLYMADAFKTGTNLGKNRFVTDFIGFMHIADRFFCLFVSSLVCMVEVQSVDIKYTEKD